MCAPGPTIVAAAGITAGQRVLDVAAGAGRASIPAAEAGASVVASDLTPELLDVGRATAAARGVALEWVKADAEALPFNDNEFDTVISVVGAMFAPHHQQTANEMLRVRKPGGTIAMINSPEGLIGQLFATMRPYAPPPPPGVQPPPLWGNESHQSASSWDSLSAVATPNEYRRRYCRKDAPTAQMHPCAPRCVRTGRATYEEETPCRINFPLPFWGPARSGWRRQRTCPNASCRS
jgi:SAM-dependent methyltransferase